MDMLRRLGAVLAAAAQRAPRSATSKLKLSLPTAAAAAAGAATYYMAPLQPAIAATTSELQRATRGISIHSYAANDPIEDRASICARPGAPLLACVFDGHGGAQVADFTRRHMSDVILAELAAVPEAGRTPTGLAALLTRAFLRLERSLVDALRGAFQVGFGDVARVGCCAIVAAVSPRWITVANAGDCRAVLGVVHAAPLPDLNAALVQQHELEGRQVYAVALSEDHNARMPREVDALRAAHPGEADVVLCKSPHACYVKGRLQPTRAIGDAYLKYSEFNGVAGSARSAGRHIPHPYTPPYITAEPEVKGHVFTDDGGEVLPQGWSRSPVATRGESFLILACDGVWDVLSNQEAVALVASDTGDRATVAQRVTEVVLEREAAACGMTRAALEQVPPGRGRRNLHDDITLIVIFLGDVAADAGEDSDDQQVVSAVRGLQPTPAPAAANSGKSKGWLW